MESSPSRTSRLPLVILFKLHGSDRPTEAMRKVGELITGQFNRPLVQPFRFFSDDRNHCPGFFEG